MLEIVDQETALRGFLLTGDRQYLGPFERAHPDGKFERLHEIVADSPSQQAQFDQAHQHYREWYATCEAALNGHDLDQARSPAAMLARKARMDDIREAMAVATDIEKDLLRARRRLGALDRGRADRLRRAARRRRPPARLPLAPSARRDRQHLRHRPRRRAAGPRRARGRGVDPRGSHARRRGRAGREEHRAGRPRLPGRARRSRRRRRRRLLRARRRRLGAADRPRARLAGRRARDLRRR
ncbi:CHASE3 domain-containing protein [Nannocystis pusilla]|uniref:CHASE3 domain-containing protein n=1 Tax=Nannocystis pusilla TaxID=889268 RepID=UPI003B835A05